MLFIFYIEHHRGNPQNRPHCPLITDGKKVAKALLFHSYISRLCDRIVSVLLDVLPRGSLRRDFQLDGSRITDKMGIPAAFRWLSSRYPKIISPVIEDQPITMEDGSTIPVDTTRPNPNGEEFDNLYLDMNGIVHPCSHPEDRPAPKDEEEMMMEVFRYTDRVVNMVRPRKILMIAVGASLLCPRLHCLIMNSSKMRLLDADKVWQMVLRLGRK